MLNDILDSTNSLTETIEEAGKVIIDPSMTKIQELLNSIASDFKWEPTRKLIEETYLETSKVKMRMRRLKDDLNVLADTTVIRVKAITKAIDALTEDASDAEIDFDFHTMVRGFIAFLNNSKERLQAAQEKYKEVQETFIQVETSLNLYKNELESYLKNEDKKLENFVNKFRTVNYGVAAACVIWIFLCPTIYAFTAIATELTIADVKSDLEHQKNNANKALDAVELSNVEIQNAYEFINAEVPLIMKWSDRLNEVSGAAHSVENVLQAIKLRKHIYIKDALAKLSVACENYLKNEPEVTSRMYP